MKRYEVRLLGEKLGEKHYGIFDTVKADYITDSTGVIAVVFTSEVVAIEFADGLNEKK